MKKKILHKDIHTYTSLVELETPLICESSTQNKFSRLSCKVAELFEFTLQNFLRTDGRTSRIE